MIRKLILPVAAAALLGGCVTAGYSYRQGSGDYYHGRPSVEYRYYGSPYSSGPYPYGYYGSPYGYYGSPYGSYRYAYPAYGYRQYYYGYPYAYPYGGSSAPRPRVDPTPDSSRSPWRNLDGLQRRSIAPSPITRPRKTQFPQPPMRSAPAPSGESSAIGGMVRRAKERDRSIETTP